MSGIDQESASFINPTLERVQRLERAVLHIAGATELALADIALNGVSLDASSAEAEGLRRLGAALLHVSSVGMNTANSVAAALGEAPWAQAAQTQAEQSRIPATTLTNVKPRVATEPTLAEPGGTPEISRPEAPTVVTPKASRLNRQPNTSEDAAETPVGSPTSEKKKRTYEGELYARIVPGNQTPIMELREGMEPIPVRIISDDTIVVNGEEVVLEGDQLFIFNSLMKLRANMITAKQIRGLGFRVDGSSASAVLSKAMSQLMTELEVAAGAGQPAIIKKLGKAAGVKYAVNPAVVLEDKRLNFGSENSGSTQDIADTTPEVVKKN